MFLSPNQCCDRTKYYASVDHVRHLDSVSGKNLSASFQAM